MRVERVVLWLTWRSLFSRRFPGIIHGLSWLTMLALVVGVCTIFLVVNVFNGFDRLIRELYRSFYPDFVIRPVRGVLFSDTVAQRVHRVLHGLPVRYCTAFEQQAVFQYGNERHVGRLLAIDTACWSLLYVDSMLVAWNEGERFQGGVALLGAGVAYLLRIHLEALLHTFRVYVLNPRGVLLGPGVGSQEVFRVYTLRPVGIFQVLQEIDTRYVIVPLEGWWQLMGRRNAITTFFVRVSGEGIVGDVVDQVEAVCRECEVLTRQELHRTLFWVLRAEKWVSLAVLGIIVVFASATLLSMLVMLILYKRRDIQILQAMGMDRKAVQRVFWWHGMLIMGLGWLVGMVLSLVLTWIQQEYGLVKIQGETFLIQAYPVAIEWQDYVLISVFIFVVGWLFSWLPSRLVRRIHPVFRGE